MQLSDVAGNKIDGEPSASKSESPMCRCEILPQVRQILDPRVASELMTKPSIFSLVFILLVSSFMQPAAADKIGYIEDFALAKNREKALAQLIPGTDDYYFFHCLHYQNTQQFAKVEALMKPWIERHGENARVQIILNRHALLTYPDNPKKSLDSHKKAGADIQPSTTDHRKETGAAVDARSKTDQPRLSEEAGVPFYEYIRIWECVLPLACRRDSNSRSTKRLA